MARQLLGTDAEVPEVSGGVTDAVTGFVGLWMREDGVSPGLAFDNMQQRGLKGTNDWAEYSITLPVKSEAKQLFFGVLVSGTGKAWADDLQLLVDGKPIWEAPKVEKPKTVLDLDHEFDGGSKISSSSLTSVQTAIWPRSAKCGDFSSTIIGR